MNAQNFHGVSIGGTVQAPTIVNNSDKPIIGHAVQRVTTTGLNALVSVVNFHSLAVGKAIQPGGSIRLADSTWSVLPARP